MKRFLSALLYSILLAVALVAIASGLIGLGVPCPWLATRADLPREPAPERAPVREPSGENAGSRRQSWPPPPDLDRDAEQPAEGQPVGAESLVAEARVPNPLTATTTATVTLRPGPRMRTALDAIARGNELGRTVYLRLHGIRWPRPAEGEATIRVFVGSPKATRTTPYTDRTWAGTVGRAAPPPGGGTVSIGYRVGVRAHRPNADGTWTVTLVMMPQDGGGERCVVGVERVSLSVVED
jgi:hypothetical protein